MEVTRFVFSDNLLIGTGGAAGRRDLLVPKAAMPKLIINIIAHQEPVFNYN